MEADAERGYSVGFSGNIRYVPPVYQIWLNWGLLRQPRFGGGERWITPLSRD